MYIIAKKYIPLFAILTLASGLSCSNSKEEAPEAGVSWSLAQKRKEQLSNIAYTLHFIIPENREDPVFASLELTFTLREKAPVILDFKADEQQIQTLYVNESARKIRYVNEHIIIQPNGLTVGKNRVQIDFIAGDQSLNRNKDYLYTLLVPDRARTLFPCFDQPDLKAVYTLSLTIPQAWKAVANGKIADISQEEQARSRIDFEPTEPLSTYLFSFVAGELQQRDYLREGRPVSIYHRETDPGKLPQIDRMADQIYFCLHWMEDYTAIPYPFAKYDAIVLPGFQYGGMEHTGATLYNDKRLLLGEHPTTEEELSRTELIAHEIAHLWFGDYVSMKWFDDVWTKEVFAGYFAAQMGEPLFPQLNHKLSALKQFIPPAYSDDRTQGAVAIKQPLDNLQDAGLVYGKTIYNKAPVVMRMLAEKLGADAFRIGLQTYLQKFAYSNASWEDLIDILDEFTSDDLKAWSHNWVAEKGMPEISLSVEKGLLREQQIDPEDLGRIWPQSFKHELMPGGFVVPNTDGAAYGFFSLDAENLHWNVEHWGALEDPVTRLSVLINLHEHLARRRMQPDVFAEALLKQLPKEENVQIFGSLPTYLQAAVKMNPDLAPACEEAWWRIVRTHPKQEFRQMAFNLLIENAVTSASAAALYDVWRKQQAPPGIYLSENQYMTLAYELAVRLPDQADTIIQQHLLRLRHPDKIREFSFIAPAVSPQKSTRDSLFHSLLKAENRRIEPWTVKALHYLNHPLRHEDALDYIQPALEVLPEIQRTGDIFLPANWCAALLDGHNSLAAAERLRDFLEAHRDMPILLKNKILQNGDWLLKL